MQPDSTPRDRAQHEPYQFSPQKEYDGANILLTGSLGYLGSVVLEQLLRATQVGELANRVCVHRSCGTLQLAPYWDSE